MFDDDGSSGCPTPSLKPLSGIYSEYTQIPLIPFGKLTRQQRVILHEVVKGKSNHEIALEVSLAASTVGDHLKHIFKAVGVHDRAALACRYYGPAHPGQLADLSAQHNLSPRETDILALTASGLTNKEIGAQLSISPHTVTDHLKRLYPKIKVHSCYQILPRLHSLEEKGDYFFKGLRPLERTVAGLLISGLPEDGIARALDIPARLAEQACSAVLAKSEVGTAIELQFLYYGPADALDLEDVCFHYNVDGEEKAALSLLLGGKEPAALPLLQPAFERLLKKCGLSRTGELFPFVHGHLPAAPAIGHGQGQESSVQDAHAPRP